MRKIYDYIIAAFVFLSAMFYLSGKNFHMAQNDLFHLLGPAIIACMFCLNPVRHIKNYWLNAFALFALACVLFSKSPRELAIEPMVNIFIALGIFYAIANYLDERKYIYYAMFLVMVLNFIQVVFQYFGIDPLCITELATANRSHLVGFFGHPMNLGIYSALMLPIFAYRFKKWLWIPVICLLASKSFFAIPIGCVALLAYFIITKQKRWTAVSIACGVIAAAILVTLSAGRLEWVWRAKFAMRFDLYMEMLKAGLSSGSPFGYGLGTFRQVANQLQVVGHGTIGAILEPWNEYLGWLLEMGPIAVGIVVGMFYGVLNALKHIRDDAESVALYCSLATIPIGICFHSYTYFVNTGIISLVIFAMFHITKEEVC